MSRSNSWSVLTLLAGLSYIGGTGCLRAQTQLDQSGQTTIVRPGACPSELHAGLLGYFYGYEHAGHSWTTDWQLNENLDPVNHARAKYVPDGNPFYIDSRDRHARWYHPAFIAHCQIFESWFMGRIVDSTIDVRVEVNLGEVKECGDATAMAFPADYDPYDPTDPYGDEGCTTAPTEAGAGGSGSGIQYQPGDHTGGETVDWETGIGNGGVTECGNAAVVEQVCIESWNDVTQKWDVYACGYATTC